MGFLKDAFNSVKDQVQAAGQNIQQTGQAAATNIAATTQQVIANTQGQIRDASGSIKGAVSDVKKANAKLIAEIKKNGGKLSKRTAFGLLLPLKPTMVAILKARSIPVKMSDTMEKICMLFADVVIRGKQSLQYQMYEKLNHLDIPPEAIEAAAPAIMSTIQLILKWFKDKVDAKRQGKAQSEEDTIAAIGLIEADKPKKRKGFFARLFDALLGR